jgi:hypothetical protein
LESDDKVEVEEWGNSGVGGGGVDCGEGLMEETGDE